VCVLKAAADPGLWGDFVMLVADILDVEVLVRLSRNYIPSVTVQIFSFTFLSLSHTQRHTLFLCCAIALQYPGTVIRACTVMRVRYAPSWTLCVGVCVHATAEFLPIIDSFI